MRRYIFGCWCLLFTGILAVHVASAGKITDSVRSTLARGGDPNKLFKARFYKIRPLHAVIGDTPDHLQAAKLLLKAGARVDGRDEKGNTPLHRAARLLAPRFAQLLLEHGADPNARNKSNETPLHELSVASGYLRSRFASASDRRRIATDLPATARVLLGRGANPKLKDKLGRTPLDRMIESAPAAVVGMLLEAGADPNRIDHSGRSYLQRAASFNPDPEVVTVLLKHGARVSGTGLLTQLINDNRIRHALAMVRAGVPVNGYDKLLGSPLSAAVMTALTRGRSKLQLELIKALLERGARHDSRGLFGKATAIQLASRDKVILALFGEKQGRGTGSAGDAITPRKSGSSAGLSGKGAHRQPADPEINRIVSRIMKAVKQAVDDVMAIRRQSQTAARLSSLSSHAQLKTRIDTLERYSQRLKNALDQIDTAPRRIARVAARNNMNKARRHALSLELADSLFDMGEPALSAWLRAERTWIRAVIDGYRQLASYPQHWQLTGDSRRPLTITHRGFARRFQRTVVRIRTSLHRARLASARLARARHQRRRKR